MAELRPQHPERPVPPSLIYPPDTLPQILSGTARRYPGRTAIVYCGAQVRYARLDALVDRWAAALQQDPGLRRGDRVAILLPNSLQFVIAYYAVLRAGGIAVPFQPLQSAPELHSRLHDCGARAIFTRSGHYTTVQRARRGTPLKRIIVTGSQDCLPPSWRSLFALLREGREGHCLDDPGACRLQPWLLAGPPAPHAVRTAPEDTAVLLYVDGRAGAPLAADLSHRNLVANALQYGAWADACAGRDVLLATTPLYHAQGMTLGMNGPIAYAATTVLTPDPEDARQALRAARRYRAAACLGVPALYAAISHYLPITHAGPPGGEAPPESLGLPLPDTQARIVDLDSGTRELPPGEVGELAVRGPQVIKGFWRRPEESARAIRDGWLHTGALARKDAEGFFYLMGSHTPQVSAERE